jgi:hypothetical protein
MDKFVRKSNRFSLIKTVLLGLSLFVHFVYAATPNCQDLKGHWMNELGSTLIITGVKKKVVSRVVLFLHFKRGAKNFW